MPTAAAADWGLVLDAILEGFQVISPDFRYLYLNETAARHGRTTRAALLGRTMMECYPGIDQTPFFSVLRRCLLTKSHHVLENAFTFPDGSLGHFELRIQPVPQGVCVLSLDVTARKQAEQARGEAEERLRHAQRMEAVGQLAAGIAHDFNNLLTVILGQGELALERAQGPLRDDLQTMMEAARLSADLTRQLLAYGRRTALNPEVLDLGEMVRGMERLLRPALPSRIDLRLELDPAAGRVQADRAQLEQVILNLVLNARDAIAGNGRVTVAVQPVDLDREYAAAHPDTRSGPHTMLAVTDTGVGMDAATRSRIFEPFFTTKERGQGTGLGLATVYGNVKQAGGNIWVYSEPGQGSTFKVYLPNTDCPQTPAAAAPVARPPVQRVAEGATVLVAEDAPLLRKLMQAALERAGYHLLLANNGEQALELWQAQADKIALLITDVVMPAVDGVELIRRVRQRRPDLPVICTSGYADRHLREQTVMPANVVYLEKPFTPRALLERVEELIRAGAHPAER